MIALAVDPARNTDGLANVGFTEFFAGMGSIGVHDNFPGQNTGVQVFVGYDARNNRQNTQLAAKGQELALLSTWNRPNCPYLLGKTRYLHDPASAGGDVSQKLVYSILA